MLGQAGSPPAAAAVTFASIVEEEKQQEAALIRSREKPLALIQVTECLKVQLYDMLGNVLFPVQDRSVCDTGKSIFNKECIITSGSFQQCVHLLATLLDTYNDSPHYKCS